MFGNVGASLKLIETCAILQEQVNELTTTVLDLKKIISLLEETLADEKLHKLANIEDKTTKSVNKIMVKDTEERTEARDTVTENLTDYRLHEKQSIRIRSGKDYCP